MAIFTTSPYMTVPLICGIILLIMYKYFTQVLNYWKEKGVPFLSPSFVFGNTKDMFLMRLSPVEMFQKLYSELQGYKYAGIFSSHKPILLLRDPDIIKHVMIKDFSYFHDRIGTVDKINNPLSLNLFNVKGLLWKTLRVKLSPTFTSGKIKLMFHIVNECANELVEYLRESATEGDCLEFKDVAAKYTTDVIGTCAFGMQFNSIKDPNSEFRVVGKKMFESTSSQIVRRIKRVLLALFPFLKPYLEVQFPDKSVYEFFLRTVKDVVEYRQKNNVKRNDFMQLLIQLKNEGQVEGDDEAEDNGEERRNGLQKRDTALEDFEISYDLLTAQVFVFFVGGFETSSATISFCLYELAVNPDIQQRLQEEIDSVFQETGDKITYDVVQNMKYLDQVVSETLRKYPPLGLLFRECTKQYRLPDSDVILDPGTNVYIPIYALHYDPKYYPEPKRFDPERFTEENKAKRTQFTYLPFGEGPRICIGMRFATVQVKLGLIALLRHYNFKVSEKTAIPLRLDPKSFLTNPYNGIWLQVFNRSKLEK